MFRLEYSLLPPGGVGIEKSRLNFYLSFAAGSVHNMVARVSGQNVAGQNFSASNLIRSQNFAFQIK